MPALRCRIANKPVDAQRSDRHDVEVAAESILTSSGDETKAISVPKDPLCGARRQDQNDIVGSFRASGIEKLDGLKPTHQRRAANPARPVGLLIRCRRPASVPSRYRSWITSRGAKGDGRLAERRDSTSPSQA